MKIESWKRRWSALIMLTDYWDNWETETFRLRERWRVVLIPNMRLAWFVKLTMPLFQQRWKSKSCNEQLPNAPRYALVPMEFKFHLSWILAAKWHCFGSPTWRCAYCQKLNWGWVRRLMLTLYLDWQLPMMGKIKMYIKLDLTILGLKVPNVGMLITEEPNQVLDKEPPKSYLGL